MTELSRRSRSSPTIFRTRSSERRKDNDKSHSPY